MYCNDLTTFGENAQDGNGMIGSVFGIYVEMGIRDEDTELPAGYSLFC